MPEISEQLKDHEDRLRTIEKSQLEMKYSFLSIENSQKDLKLIMQEMNKNQSDLLTKFVNCTLDNSKTDETIKLTNNKNMWTLIFKIGVVLAPFVSAGLAVYLNK